MKFALRTIACSTKSSIFFLAAAFCWVMLALDIVIDGVSVLLHTERQKAGLDTLRNVASVGLDICSILIAIVIKFAFATAMAPNPTAVAGPKHKRNRYTLA